MNIFTFNVGLRFIMTGGVLLMWTCVVGLELVKIKSAQNVCRVLTVVGISFISVGLVITTWSFA